MSDNAVVISASDSPSEVHERLDDLCALMEAVDKDRPVPSDLAELDRWFDETPGLWAVFGDLGAFVQKKIIEGLSSTNSGKAAIEKGRDLQRQALGYEYSPPLERVLIDHALTCWLRLQDAEWRYTQVISESTSLPRGDYWERRLSAAQRRYLRSCETLARVRKIIRRTPALQVNIATHGGSR